MQSNITAWRTAVDIGATVGDRFGVVAAARVTAARALRLRQPGIDTIDKDCDGRSGHARSVASALSYGNNTRDMKKRDSFVQRGGWWVVAQFFLLIMAVFLPMWSADTIPVLHEPIMLVGRIVAIAGITLFAIACTTLITRRALTPFPRPTQNGSFANGGLYRFMRHPLYTGVVVSTLGWSLVLLSVAGIVLALAIAVFFDRKAVREERWLRQRFPAYAGYAQRVPKFLPGIY